MTKRRIGELLVDAGLIQGDQLQKGLELQAAKGGKIVENLIKLGYLNAEEFASFLARQPGVASIDLSECVISRDVITLIPREIAIKHEVVPIDRLGPLLTVAMVCPLDHALVQDIESRTGLRVKPLLCLPNDIRAVINRYYPSDQRSDPQEETEGPNVAGLNATIKLSRVAAMVRQVDALPALPESVRRVQEATTNLESSVRDVANIIMFDPPIAAKVLSVANSAAYGFSQRIDDVTQAVSLLGLREVYSIVLSFAIVNTFKQSDTIDYKSFWLTSIRCAAATLIVANAGGRKREPGVFSAGLLHDIGRLVLARVAPDIYARVDQNLNGRHLAASEEDIVGLSHMEAGYLFATHWELPVEIAEPIRYHHRPEFAIDSKDRVAIVAIASELAELRGEPQESDRGTLQGLHEPMRMLGIDEEAAEAMLSKYLTVRAKCLDDSLSKVLFGQSPA